MENKTCQDCTHFIQHWHEVEKGYVTGEKMYERLNCGHCKYPRLKTRAPGTRACQHFKEREISSETG